MKFIFLVILFISCGNTVTEKQLIFDIKNKIQINDNKLLSPDDSSTLLKICLSLKNKRVKILTANYQLKMKVSMSNCNSETTSTETFVNTTALLKFIPEKVIFFKDDIVTDQTDYLEPLCSKVYIGESIKSFYAVNATLFSNVTFNGENIEFQMGSKSDSILTPSKALSLTVEKSSNKFTMGTISLYREVSYCSSNDIKLKIEQKIL